MALTCLLLPFHKLLRGEGNTTRRLRHYVQMLSPVADRYEAYPHMDKKLLDEWALLDTHDLLTDRYKHCLSGEEISRTLTACGLSEIEVRYAGNGVEAQATR